MSGHSKWSQIKHKKALTDAKKGKIFSKLARLITVAARQKGGDVSGNSALRMITEKARSLNMPNENIERAIKKGTGELEDEKMEEMIIEAYGPAGVALIIEAITDNKNRTISEIKHALNQYNSKLAESGSVNWLFERRGALAVNLLTSAADKESLELLAIDSGAQDLKWLDEENLVVYTKAEDLEKIKKQLEAKNIKIDSASLEWSAKNEIEISDPKAKEHLEKLLSALDEHPDVQEVYLNINE